jgi:hypothetical protein
MQAHVGIAPHPPPRFDDDHYGVGSVLGARRRTGQALGKRLSTKDLTKSGRSHAHVEGTRMVLPDQPSILRYPFVWGRSAMTGHECETSMKSGEDMVWECPTPKLQLAKGLGFSVQVIFLS